MDCGSYLAYNSTCHKEIVGQAQATRLGGKTLPARSRQLWQGDTTTAGPQRGLRTGQRGGRGASVCGARLRRPGMDLQSMIGGSGIRVLQEHHVEVVVKLALPRVRRRDLSRLQGDKGEETEGAETRPVQDQTYGSARRLRTAAEPTRQGDPIAQARGDLFPHGRFVPEMNLCWLAAKLRRRRLGSQFPRSPPAAAGLGRR